MVLEHRLGIQPATREELAIIYKLLNGDMALSLSPATLGSSAAAVNTAIAGDGFSRDVEITLVDSSGNIYDNIDFTFAVAVAAVTAGDGDCALEGAISNITLSNGKATVTINYTGTWAADDTSTLTVTGGTHLGYSITNKTSVDTLVA